MALICFSAGGLLLFGLLMNPDQLPVSNERRIFSIGLMAVAGTAYWVFARYFRVWMLHVIITAGLISGCVGLSQMDTSIGSAMTILSIFWTCLLIGSIFTPPVARSYGAFTFVGIALALSRTAISAAENAVVALGFGLTIIVTMELLSRTNSRLRDEATRDPLTGLLNRKGLTEVASQAVRLALRTGQPLAIASFDLNDFKAVNDQQGHLAGDRLLIRCAEYWSANIRPQDVLARPGGDEFLLLLPGTEADEAEMIMQRLGESSPVSFAHGIAVAMPGDSIDAKLAEADTELIRTKAARRRVDAKSPGPGPAASPSQTN